jgi:hypothetical protein
MIEQVAVAVLFFLARAETRSPACLGVLVDDLWGHAVCSGGDRLCSDGSRFGRWEVILVRFGVIQISSYAYAFGRPSCVVLLL